MILVLGRAGMTTGTEGDRVGELFHRAGALLRGRVPIPPGHAKSHAQPPLIYVALSSTSRPGG